MRQFTYTIQSENGLHGRPAVQLVQLAAAFACRTEIRCGERTADLGRMFAVLGLCVRRGDCVSVTTEGTDEEKASAALQEFFIRHL